MMHLDLSGEWRLQEAGSNDSIPAQVPGDTHSALLAAERIPHPYWGTNELQVQWVGQRDWTFSRTFTVSAEMLAEETVVLRAESLDTIATLAINGQEIGTSRNMFARFQAEVKAALKEGENELRIAFTSPEKAALAAAEELPYPIPTSGAPVTSPHRNLVRKVQCHAGWDWGICLMVSGIYGGIELLATSGARIEHVMTTQAHEEGRCTVTVEAEVTAQSAGTQELSVTLGEQSVSRQVKLKPGTQTISAEVAIDNPKLWWPNGMGEQPLYDLTVELAGQRVSKRLGLRTIEMFDEEDEIGRSMWFRVNGRDFFCKGANWIPVDALPRRHTEEVYRDLLESATAANMNMLRVWGGGQYERDAFYEICDELGLLIWHDFMFSCSLYPAQPDFLENVRDEAEYQVKRLRDHACLAIWCGNNENVGALNWYEESRQDRDRYLVDYDRLNEGVLGQTVDTFDPTRRFWPSSPCGGRGDYRDCWHDDSRGDMHYWSVWHEGKSFDAYYAVTPRFCSEFGYQSFPSLDTVRTYAPVEEFNVTAPVMEHHQKNNRGNSLISEMFTRIFRMPEGFANVLYLSQVQQALAIKMAVEYWRTLRPTCMGTLYWQINDNWPVASWASIEYGGKWKLLHYLARRFYAPLMPAIVQLDDTLEIRIASDLPKAAKVDIALQTFTFDGEAVWSDTWSQSVEGDSAAILRTYQVADLAPVRNERFLRLTMTHGGETTTTEHVFTQWKRCYLERTEVSSEVSEAGDGAFRVTVRANAPAFFVTLNASDIAGEFSDNCFGLIPGESRQLTFTPKEKTSLDSFRKSLTIKHLRNTYE